MNRDERPQPHFTSMIDAVSNAARGVETVTQGEGLCPNCKKWVIPKEYGYTYDGQHMTDLECPNCGELLAESSK